MSHVGKSKTSCRCLDSRHKNGSPSVAPTMKGSIPDRAETVRPRIPKGVRFALQPRIPVKSRQFDFGVHQVR